MGDRRQEKKQYLGFPHGILVEMTLLKEKKKRNTTKGEKHDRRSE